MWNDESERERRRVDTKGCKLKFDVTSDNFSVFFTGRERERTYAKRRGNEINLIMNYRVLMIRNLHHNESNIPLQEIVSELNHYVFNFMSTK